MQHKRIVWVTGASRGIGRATAHAFAREGANVVVHFRQNQSAAEAVRKDLEGDGHLLLKGDVADPEQIQNMYERVMAAFGRIDVLVNNAGIYTEHPPATSSFEDWQKQWNRILQVNLMGPALLSQLVGQQMIEQESGAIINVGSRGAFRGEPDSPAYGASKGGLHSMSQSLAKALGKYGISVTCVAPGFVETDMGKSVLDGPKGPALRAESPFGRVAQPEEVADTILFLASEKAKFLSGGIIDINGASYLRS